MSELGDMTFLFQTPMVITDEFRDKLMPNSTNHQLNEQLDAILRINVVSADNEETLEDDFLAWNVTSVTSDDLTLKVVFKESIDVSQGYYPDIMLVYYDFSELKDIYGGHPAQFDFARREIPPQMEPGTVASNIDTAGSIIIAAVASIAASSWLTNILISGSLNLIWGMVNSL